jgi:glucokinase
VNLPWPVDGSSLERMLGARVTLVNDVEANARGIEELDPGDLEVLNAGVADPAGARAVVSAGTGLGEAALWWDGSRHRAAASEGGHCSFAPQSEIEVELYRFLAAEYGHVSYERVCSGAGLANIYRFLARGTVAPEPAAISAEAHADPDSVSARALDLFVSIYGARAGDVAFQYMATGGVYLGGGIAPKVLDRLRAGGFMRAFLAEGRLAWLLRRMPVLVILNPDTALYGAAAIASSPPMRAPG